MIGGWTSSAETVGARTSFATPTPHAPQRFRSFAWTAGGVAVALRRSPAHGADRPTLMRRPSTVGRTRTWRRLGKTRKVPPGATSTRPYSGAETAATIGASPASNIRIPRPRAPPWSLSWMMMPDTTPGCVAERIRPQLRSTAGPDYLVLHRATCRFISHLGPNMATFTGDYIKVCSTDRTAVRQWAHANAGAEGTFCQHCLCTPAAPIAVRRRPLPALSKSDQCASQFWARLPLRVSLGTARWHGTLRP